MTAQGVAKGYGLFVECIIATNSIQFEGYMDEVDVGGSGRLSKCRKSDGKARIPFSYGEMWNDVWGVALKYIGEIKQGLYSGKGILYNPDGTISYEDKFEKGKFANS